ncbi:SDR family oxidoreductase [Streptomyces sp. ISL-98]|uniref:SDR family NAD(P)-dependent oxidoreductase n=1 Tax=Streptomyces sp. ISL-98 TaxID=2819192 RepID=UPI001BE94429|nr:SDR family oxidoreductase [Streptomyces sp. ISL-98]MBT2511718.1 SDR family oxidoreductase [Streptomyces sp. ISL-98]
MDSLVQRTLLPRPRTKRSAPQGAGLAVVTGGSSGIGQEAARLLARRGHPTVLIARRRDALNDLALELSALAPSMALALDVCDDQATQATFGQLVHDRGPVRVLVNCAGSGLYSPFLKHEPTDLRRMMEIHYFAAATAIRSVLPGMLDQRAGHVVNIGSMSTKMGPWGHSGYTAAKAALTALTQTLAADYASSGVHFSVVHPGIIDTPYFDTPDLQPLRQQLRRHLINPERVARTVVRLLDRPRLEVCVPHHYRLVDAIKALHPTMLHHLVASHSRPTKC